MKQSLVKANVFTMLLIIVDVNHRLSMEWSQRDRSMERPMALHRSELVGLWRWNSDRSQGNKTMERRKIDL